MKKLILTAIAVLTLAAVSFGATWNIDATHSSVGFKVSHMVISKVTGGFEEFSGTITDFDGEKLEGGSVEFTVQTASVDTDDEGRDKHLRNEDFFEVEKYPTMTFKSKSISADGNSFKLTGDLTIKDVTKEVTFDGTFAGSIDDPWGNKRAGFSAAATIDRKDFGIAFGKVMDNGGLMVGNEVEIMIELETVMTK